MNCREIAELMPLYLSGDLDEARAAEFTGHLSACPDCAQTAKREQDCDARLREIVLSDSADANPVIRRVRERIAGESLASIVRHPVSRSTRRFAVILIGAAAAFALVLLGYHGLLGPQVPRVYAAAVQDHRLEVVEHQPRRWLTDPLEILELARRQGIALPSIAALAPRGFQLDRAKICFLSGEAFLHLVYSNGSQEFSVYLRHQSFGQLPGLARISAGGSGFYECALDSGHVVSFQKASVAVVVVSGRSAAAATAFAHTAFSRL